MSARLHKGPEQESIDWPTYLSYKCKQINIEEVSEDKDIRWRKRPFSRWLLQIRIETEVLI